MATTGHNQKVGSVGEEVAVSFLKKLGFRLLARNYRCRGGEVDIIATDRGTIVFVEVKARNNAAYGLPQLAVTPFKQRQIARAAQIWLSRNRMHEAAARFDVVAIQFTPGGHPTIEHIRNAFDLPA
jgi:putative endonuclease